MKLEKGQLQSHICSIAGREHLSFTNQIQTIMKKQFTLSLIAFLFTSWSVLANCPEVTGLQASSANGTDILLSWDAMPGATQYQLKVEQEETGNPFVFWLSLSDNSYLLEGLAPDGIYKFKVRTVCGGEKASWSEYQFFSGSTGSNGGSGSLCEAPIQLTAVLDANGTAMLSWAEVPGALLYEVEVESEDGTPFFFASFNTTDAFAEVTGLEPNGLYKFKVKSQCGGSASSDYSEWVFFTADGSGSGGNGGACEVPTGLMVLNISNGEATLTWDPVPGALAYEVEVEDDENTPPFEWNEIVTTNQVTVAGLAANGSYQFKVKAKCDSNNSLYSPWLFFTTGNGGSGGNGGNGGNGGGSCDTPTGLMVSDITSGSALISWEAVAGAQGYEVQVEDDENTPAFNWEVIVTGTEVTVDGLSPNGNYQVKVKAKCSGGNNSAATDWVFFTTGSNLSQNSPQMMSKQVVEATAFRLSPNPAHGGQTLLLELEQSQEQQDRLWVGIYDLQGQLRHSREVAPGELGFLQLPTTGLQPGMYQVVIRSKETIQSRRFSLLD